MALTDFFSSTLQHGRIVEEGTYDELMRRGDAFSKLMSSFGGVTEDEADGSDATKSADEDELTSPTVTADKLAKITRKSVRKAAGTGKLEVIDRHFKRPLLLLILLRVA